MRRAILLLTILSLPIVEFAACESSSDDDGAESTDDSGGPAETIVYTVTVNGVEVPVHRVDRFEAPVSFVRFDHIPGATIAVTSAGHYDSFKLSPEVRGIAASKTDNTLSFSVAEPEYLILQPSGLERLLILIDPPEVDAPLLGAPGVVNIMDFGVDATGSTLTTAAIQAGIDAVEGTGSVLYVPPGTYLTGEIWMKSGMTLYLADGAVLKGSSNLADIVTANSAGSTVEQCLHALVRMNGVIDSHIRGRGILDGNGTFHRDAERPETKYNLLKIEDSSNCSIDGVTALDSSFWNTIVYRSDSIGITNYKVVNHYKPVGWNETDGVDFDNATNSRLSNSLLYVGDDCMATKSDDIPDDYERPPGIDNYPADPTANATYLSVNNVVHENVVCFTNQAAAKVGTKTMGSEMSDIVFRNIDVVRCGRGLVIDNMDTANVHDVTFDNVTFEYAKPFDGVNFIIRNGTDWRYSEGVGRIEDIVASNITFQGFSGRPMFRIEGRTEDETDPPEVYSLGAISFTNVVVNDQPVTVENATEVLRVLTHEAEDVTFQ